ncbi:Oxr1 [Symbiodinium natans]|uniref:Oxr1 protein n=1 Tax=Symbiodinium natans TaxID=878477 RepID=A0A812RK48_9DINO|nr:Oxr1 [Symbiodinium natans]
MLPSLFLAPEASSLKASVSRTSLTGSLRSASSRCLSFSDESNDGLSEEASCGSFFAKLPSQVVLQTTGSLSRSYWAEDLSPCRRSKQRWLPVLPEGRRLLSEARLRLIRPQLPISCRIASAWRLLYDPRVHGVSIGTFFRQCQAWPGETLIFIEDAEGSVFGALASHTWHVASRQHFGQPSCFVFRFVCTEAGEDIEVYPWAGTNQYFLFADSGGLKIGGGRSPAIWINADFLKGASGPCETFGTTAPLSGSEEFVVRSFECWGFDTATEQVTCEDARLLLREQAWEQARGVRQFRAM